MKTPISLLATTLLWLQPAMEANSSGAYEENLLRGSYAFSFDGYITGEASIPITAMGVIEIDWRGSIPAYPVGAFEEIDAIGRRTMVVDGTLPCKNDFQCDLQAGRQGTGDATCIPLNVDPPGCLGSAEDPFEGPIETFSFVIEDSGQGFRYLGTTPEYTVLGSGRSQLVSGD